MIPADLRPPALRDELTDLGEAFRAYQRGEPDLARLAELQDRKTAAFRSWAQINGDPSLAAEAARAEQAANAARQQHQNRTGQTPGSNGPAVQRLLTPQQGENARSVLSYARHNSPLPGPEARLLTVMLLLRSARTGDGNITGQDLISWPLGDAEKLLTAFVASGWLHLPATVAEALASRSENATRITVPSLQPTSTSQGPFTFGRHTRPKLSGWAQKVVGEKQLRKKKTPAATRLLSLAVASHAMGDGRLGILGRGILTIDLAAFCAVPASELGSLTDQLAQTEWLRDARTENERLTGTIHERILHLACPLP
ncbi:hypothetical protein ACFYPT_37990 [Streptomyces sp. NPDC005529]|uniref:hypothetical protein n=1 Tax=unclassified Streptomyces TaxID=2593676 RepID=UPI0033B16F91